MKRTIKMGLFLAVCVLLFFFPVMGARAADTIRIAPNKKYKGMNASFAKGYEPSVKNHKLQLIVPFLADMAGQEGIWVGVSFDREEDSPFYFKTYQTRVKRSKDGVYLYRCGIKLKKDRVNGQYPLRLNVQAQAPEGVLQQEFVIYVEITDGRERTEDLLPAEENGAEGEGAKEEPDASEILRQPRVILSENGIHDGQVEAGQEAYWTLLAKNCSGSEPLYNVKVTLLCENGDLQFERQSWYFERVAAGASMDLSQNVAADQKAAAGMATAQLQFDYEDQKGGVYNSVETARLSVYQPQQARLVNFSMPEGIYESDTETVTFQAQNTGLAVLYNAKARLEGQGLFANEVYLGNIEAGSAADGEMQVFAGTLNMDAEGNVLDEDGEKYGDVKGRLVFSYENERGEAVEQEQAFSTAILKPQVAELKIEEAPEQETNQWQAVTAVMVFLFMLLAIVCLYLRMRHYADMVKRQGSR